MMRTTRSTARWVLGVALLTGGISLPSAAVAETEGVLLDGGGLAELLPADRHCDEVLLTVTPTSSWGDASAVAITSQALELGDPAWLHVSWEAPDGTSLTEITLRSAAGIHRVVGAPASGTAEGVQELVFCGTVDDGQGGGSDGADTQGGLDAIAEDEDGTEVLGVQYSRSEGDAVAADGADRRTLWTTMAAMAAVAGLVAAGGALLRTRRPAGRGGVR
jgi:hypothetical protein